MYNEFDYLNTEVLNDIEQKMQVLYQKYSAFTSKTYIAKTWIDGELVYVDEIADIETMLEYLGDGFGYPKGWITSRNWSISSSNNISYKDINRILNNISILDKLNPMPLLPRNDLYPNDTLYPRNSLPSEYTQVDYIESSGNQYISIPGTSKLYLSGTIVAQYTRTGPKNSILFGRHSMNWIGQKQSNGEYTNGTDTGVSSLLKKKIDFNFTKQGNTIEIDGQIFTRTYNDTVTNYSQKIFAGSSTGNGEIDFYSYAKLYSLKLKNNDELIFDFVPCYRNSDNEVGLYDLVNNVFYTNQGTGTFIYGKE